MNNQAIGAANRLLDYLYDNVTREKQDKIRELEYQEYLKSDDTKLRSFGETGKEWLRLTKLNKQYIRHEVSRGTEHECIIKRALMLNLGVPESHRVVTGQIFTEHANDIENNYSTEQDIMVLRRGAKPIYSCLSYTLAKPEDVIVTIEVKCKINGITGTESVSLESIIKKNKKVNLDQDHILFGIFGFEKGFSCQNLQRGGKTLPIVNELIKIGAPRNMIIAASDKYFVRKMQGGGRQSSRGQQYYFEQSLAFGYFIANVMHHIDIQDGKEKGESIRERFPMLAKTPAQVYP